jgi:hypothetical protein
MCGVKQTTILFTSMRRKAEFMYVTFRPKKSLVYWYGILQFCGLAAPGPVGMISPASSNTEAK